MRTHIDSVFSNKLDCIKIQQGEYRAKLYKGGGWSLERLIRFGDDGHLWVEADADEPTPRGIREVLRALGYWVDVDADEVES